MPFSKRSYDPQTLAAMTSAFDAAWAMVLARNLAGALSQEQAREQLAKRIMRAVDQGHRPGTAHSHRNQIFRQRRTGRLTAIARCPRIHSINDVRSYYRALSATEVQALRRLGTAPSTKTKIPRARIGNVHASAPAPSPSATHNGPLPDRAVKPHPTHPRPKIRDALRIRSACTAPPILVSSPFKIRALNFRFACTPPLHVACLSVTSRSRPVSTSKIKPRTGTSLAIQGCDLTLLICSFVCSTGSLYERKRMGTGDPFPVSFASFAFNSSSVKVANPQPVW